MGATHRGRTRRRRRNGSKKQLKGVALQDISSTEDIANLALFLASDESRTITGQSIPVDAGGYMQG